jgi:uncharacterized protein
LIYFDTSFLTPLLKQEPTSQAVTNLVDRLPAGQIAISTWTHVEFCSMLAREVRLDTFDAATAEVIAGRLQAVTEASLTVWLPDNADYELARTYLLRHETNLRGPDALHLAIAANRRTSAIYTLDRSMLAGGTVLGLPMRGL